MKNGMKKKKSKFLFIWKEAFRDKGLGVFILICSRRWTCLLKLVQYSKIWKNGLPSLMPSIALVSNYWNSLLFCPALSSHPFVQFCRIWVTFIEKDGEEKIINVPIGMSMLEAALEHDIDIEGNTRAWYSMFCTSPESPFFGLLLILLFF